MGLFYKYKNFNEFPKRKSPLSSTAGDTFRAVFVPPRVLVICTPKVGHRLKVNEKK